MCMLFAKVESRANAKIEMFRVKRPGHKIPGKKFKQKLRGRMGQLH